MNIHSFCIPKYKNMITFSIVFQHWKVVEILPHYSDVIMSAMAFRITDVLIVCSAVCSVANQRKHQSSASLAIVRGMHRWPVGSPHKGPVARKMFLFDDVIMSWKTRLSCILVAADLGIHTCEALRTLQWRHNGRDGVSNHQPHDCLFNRYSRAYQRKHQSSASLAFVWGIHRWPVNSPHKGPVTRKMFPFDDVIMI